MVAGQASVVIRWAVPISPTEEVVLMQALMQGPVTVSAMRPDAAAQYLPAAVQTMRGVANPPLELMCSITSALRLYPETQTVPGLNPFHLALTDVTVSSTALQGHIARIAKGETDPQLQQALVYDSMSWPLFQTEMMHNWDLYQRSAGDVLGTLPQAVDAWNQQIAQGYRQTQGAVRAAIGPQQFRALVPTVWATMGMNRF
jgi:hypothetical protein